MYNTTAIESAKKRERVMFMENRLVASLGTQTKTTWRGEESLRELRANCDRFMELAGLIKPNLVYTTNQGRSY